MGTDLYLGYRNNDASTPFGKFFKPEMAPLPQHVVEALQHGPAGRPGAVSVRRRRHASPTRATSRPKTATEFSTTAACRCRSAPTCPGSRRRCGRGGSAGMAPTPADTSYGTRAPTCPRTGRTGMTPAAGTARYIDRWSMISEYIGSTMLNAAIQFVDPDHVWPVRRHRRCGGGLRTTGQR